MICYIWNMDELIWKQYFTPPFIRDTFEPGIIWDSDGLMVTSPSYKMEDVEDYDISAVEKVMNAIVEAMNAACEGRTPEKTVRFDTVEYECTNLSFGALGYDLNLLLRSWGYLTGYRRLKDDVAAAIQDSLGQFIAECIKNASKGDENAEQE